MVALMNLFYKRCLLIGGVFFVVGIVSMRQRAVWHQVDELPTNDSINDSVIQSSESSLALLPELPSEIKRQVAFTSQAPFQVWDDFHEEMCEEASAYTAYRWWSNDQRSLLPAEEVEQALRADSVWESDNQGTYVSTNTTQVAELLRDHYLIPSDQVELVNISSVDDLKRLLNQGIIVAPFAGQELKNPYFKGAGPRYHMLVITGYSGDIFITNDVGTIRGANYRYQSDLLFTALHDFVPEASGEIRTGAKKVILISK